MNRRVLYPKGRTFLGKNPNGVMDRELGIIKIEERDGSPIALIANYAMHGTTLHGSNFVISGDSQGITASYVEKNTGAPMFYINAACGNLDPLYAYRDTFIERNHFNIFYFEKMLGDPILLAEKMVSTTPDVMLGTGRRIIDIPRKKGESEKEGEIIELPVQFLVPCTIIWCFVDRSPPGARYERRYRAGSQCGSAPESQPTI